MPRGRRKGPQSRPERKCLGKQAYPSRDAAEAAIDARTRNRGSYAPDWRAYRCNHCGKWHYGHRPGLGRDRGV